MMKFRLNKNWLGIFVDLHSQYKYFLTFLFFLNLKKSCIQSNAAITVHLFF